MSVELLELISVMLVDDHQYIIDGIRSIIEKEVDLKVIAEANNGKQALRILNSLEARPDVIVTDFSMPEMDGLSLVKEVKSTFPEIKMLVLSMHETAEHVQQIIDAEAEGYILKSSNTIELGLAIHTVFNGGTFYSQKLMPMLLKSKKQSQNGSLLQSLSARELDVLTLMLNEKSSKEIADELFISKRTVDSHRINIMEKTGSKTLLGLYKFAISHGFDGT